MNDALGLFSLIKEGDYTLLINELIEHPYKVSFVMFRLSPPTISNNFNELYFRKINSQERQCYI